MEHQVTLKPGTPEAFAGSMAEAMREAWDHYWPRAMPGRPDPLVGPFLDLLFVAVAQGLVRHLAEHPQAFNVTLSDETTGDVTSVDVEEDPA